MAIGSVQMVVWTQVCANSLIQSFFKRLAMHFAFASRKYCSMKVITAFFPEKLFEYC